MRQLRGGDDGEAGERDGVPSLYPAGRRCDLAYEPDQGVLGANGLLKRVLDRVECAAALVGREPAPVVDGDPTPFDLDDE